jgi:hypothetical protein
MTDEHTQQKPRRISLTVLNWVFGFGIGILGGGYIFRDWLVQGAPDDVLWANPLDPALMHWIMSWGYHALVESGDVLNFWNANQFYPYPGTLAFSDSLLGLHPFYIPLRLLGLPSMRAIYITLIFVCGAGALCTWLALQRLGQFTFWERVFITFAAHFTLGITAFLYHYQLFGVQFIPAVLLRLYLYLKDFRARDLAMALGLMAYSTTIAGYFLPMFVTASTPAVFYALHVQLRTHGAVVTLKRMGWRSVFIASGVAIMLYAVQLQPYVRLSHILPSPRPSTYEWTIASAGFTSLFVGFSSFSAWYQPVFKPMAFWEHVNFPGIVLLLALVYPITVLLRRLRNKRMLMSTPHNANYASLPTFAVLFFGTSLILSYGPVLKNFQEVHLPFHYLSYVVPGLARVRAPGRFGLFFALPLAIMLMALVRTIPRATIRQVVVTGLLLFGLVENIPAYPLSPRVVDAFGDHARIARSGALKAGTPMLMLPLSDNLNSALYGHIFGALDQLNGSTLHWARLVVGYGAYHTPEFGNLVSLDLDIQQGKVHPQSAITFARRLNIRHIYVQLDRYSPDIARKWRSVLASSGIIIEQDARSMWIQIDD